ncbi:MAG: toxin HipA [Treponema sp. CETP13]|nr:MAG: toxin HipA [Treponema sp. CETP13]
MRDAKNILVYFEDETSFIGTLRAEFIHGKELFSFEYDSKWLKNPKCLFLDPDLYLYRGRQYLPDSKNQFGVFMDSSPDRWGRLLMRRREALYAEKEKRSVKELTESDFLLGVHDIARIGAIRYKTETSGAFLSDKSENAAPPWATLRDLEYAAYNFEGENQNTQKFGEWLSILLAPGSSLGGARPKATVQDTDGNLWIAKFPSKNDEINTGAWEMVVHDLADQCGLNVPDAKMETFSKYGSTFLVRRFDRKPDSAIYSGKRIHFSSAMTLLGKQDGASGADGTSYLDIAEFIRSNGAEPQKDLVELWKRIVFSIAVTNTDDHLRNHGFILQNDGWHLSPMYDVNPNPFAGSIGNATLSLNITENDNRANSSLALKVAPFFGLSKMEAVKIVAEIFAIVQNWHSIAAHYGLSPSAIKQMKPCFADY